MVLNDEQNDRFFDTMDPLLYYVNDRLRVVEGFALDGMSPLDDVKNSLVARALWDNVYIIDDFVRDYAHRLPQKCLDLALSWKNALPGMYTLVRYQSGRALLMSDAGVFSVCGVTYELEQEIGPAPAYVEMVLLPFDDMIVYDGFLQAYDTDRTATELQRIQDEFENRCAQGIALTGQDFIRQAEVYLADKRDRELDALLADAARESEHAEEELPAGFHRGPLAGLNPEEREQAVYAMLDETFGRELRSVREFDKRVRKRMPVHSLGECLMLMTKAQLEQAAAIFGIEGFSRLRKAEMVDELAAELPQTQLPLEALLSVTSDQNRQLARRLAAGEDVSFTKDDIGAYALVWALEPYFFMFKWEGRYSVVVPDELKPLFALIDMDAIERFRRQQNQALRCAEACAVMNGIISVDDVYDQYCGLVSDVIDRDVFDQVLDTAAAYETSNFDLWTYLPTDYLIHYTLSPDFVAQEFMGPRNASGKLYRDRDTGELAIDPFDRVPRGMSADLRAELESLEEYKRELVSMRESMPMKPLSRSILENNVMDELLDNPNVIRLRSFLDERIPDGKQDYAFADEVVEQLVYCAIESGSLPEMFACIVSNGLEHCTNDPQRLSVLVTNVYNAMPSWENNGWSPQELYEQVTGRKMFYNEDGSVMRLGGDDPCPCGSGKKYRECCGR